MFLLHHTAAHRNDYLGALSLYIFKCTQVTENAKLGVLAHRTGVIQYKIRIVGLIAKRKTNIGKHPFDSLAVAVVLLTAVCFDKCKRLSAAA